MAVVLLWAGLLIAGFGVLLIASSRKTAAQATRYDGEVIGYRSRPGSKGGRTYAPVVLFRHPRAGRCMLEATIASGAPQYEIGKKLPVLVTNGDPLRGRLDTAGVVWFGGVMAAFGVVLVAIFFFAFRWSLFSVLASIGASIAIAFQLWKKKQASGADVAGLEKIIRNATTTELVPEASFDRSTLEPTLDIDGMIRKQPRQAIIAGIVLVVLSAGAMVGSWYWEQHRLAFLRRARSAEGVVVDLVRVSGKTTTWAPLIEFTPEGSWDAIRFKHSVSSSNPSWRVGDRMRVLYDPQQPSDAMVDSGMWKRITPLIPAAVGLLGLLGGLASIRSGMRRSERSLYPQPL